MFSVLYSFFWVIPQHIKLRWQGITQNSKYNKNVIIRFETFVVVKIHIV